MALSTMRAGNSFIHRLQLKSRDGRRLLPHGFWKWGVPLLVVFVVALAAFVHHHRHHARLAYRLLAFMPDSVPAYPDLVRFAVAEGKPLFQTHCARCHGADMHGTPAIGAPNLTDNVWLYGHGRVYDIERTIMYGIRSGHSKSHNITHMASFGLTGQLDDAEVREVVQYVLKLSGRPYNVAAANAGKEIYYDGQRGNCGDCHGSDAKGDSSYGSANLTLNVWNSGNTPADLYRAIYFGEHRMMPAWIGTLSLEQIRALAVYVYTVSHSKTPAKSAADGSS